MRRLTLLLTLALLAGPRPAPAVGTPAGDTIDNQAAVSWDTVSGPGATTSNLLILTVDEVIAVTTTLQTVGNVLVAPGAVGELLTYRVENVGNGAEGFTLTVFNAAVTDDFDPLLSGIFVDTDPDGAGPLLPDGVFNVADDFAYNPGAPPTLDANTAGREAVVVFVFNDIPGPGPPPADGDLGDSQLAAESVTGAGLPPDTGIAGGGDGGVDAVVAPGGSSSAAVGTYQVVSALVNTIKTATLFGPAASGTVVEYRLDVTATGAGTATGVVIRDPIPAGATYVAGTIELDSVPLTDVPGDGADFNVTNPGAITVDLGNLTSASPQRTITFRVTIN
jgi:uncharacterized repeat protein (TIGR01451 family)